ncbi:MAG: cupin domain-containing protein, partial [Casimicrobiaceae bacterium]
MSTRRFTLSHARDAHFARGLRAFFEYRDLGIAAATDGAVVAHVIRAVPGAAPAGGPHRHGTTFQLVYVLAGWIEFEYEGQGVVRLEPGSCVYQPPHIRHREVAHSDDLELLEIVMPAAFTTEEVEGVESAPASPAASPTGKTA